MELEINNSKDYDRFDWEKINDKLKITGFNQININFNLNNELIFDAVGAMELRSLLSNLLDNITKKHTIIQDTLDSNDKLKSQIKDCEFLIKRYEETVQNLNGALVESRKKTKDQQNICCLEFNDNCDINDVGKVNESTLDWQDESRKIILSRYHNLEQICEDQRAQINRLQLKVNRLNNVEEARIKRQQDVFKQIKHKSPNSYNALDKRLLSIIDGYENRILQMEKHLTFFSNLGFSFPFEEDCINNIRSDNSSSNNRESNIVIEEYKNLIGKLQREIEVIRIEKEKTDEKFELMKLDNNNRTSTEEVNEMVTTLREYKKLLDLHNIRPEKEKLKRRNCVKYDESCSSYPISVYHLEDIEFMPLKTCQKYLIEFCHHLNSKSISDAFKSLSELLKINVEYPFYVSIVNRIIQIIGNPKFPIYFKYSSNDKRLVTKQQLESSINNSVIDRHEEIVKTIDIWYHHLTKIPELEKYFHELFTLLFPTNHDHVRFFNVGVLGLIENATRMIEFCEPSNNDKTENDMKSKKQTEIILASGQAQALLEHYQNLFDCYSGSGNSSNRIYTHMNSMFSRYSEMSNVLKSIKKILNIESQKGYACIIAEIESLIAINDLKAQQHIDDLQMTADLEVLVSKIEEYDAFLPLFENFAEDILEELNLKSLDEVLVRIRSLLELEHNIHEKTIN